MGGKSSVSSWNERSSKPICPKNKYLPSVAKMPRSGYTNSGLTVTVFFLSESLNLVRASFTSSFNERLADFCFFGPHEMTLISVNAHRRSFLISIGLGSKEVIESAVAHIENE